MTQGKYTTCDNKEHPHFYLKLSMAKVRPKRMSFLVLHNLWSKMYLFR